METLPIYKIKNEFYFLDKRLSEYRNINNPSDILSYSDIDLKLLQRPTRKDIKSIYG